MKGALLPTLFLLALGTPSGGTVERGEEWQDPTVIGRNKKPAHATLVPYATMQQALAGRRDASPFYRLLNGRWKFHYASKPADRSHRRLLDAPQALAAPGGPGEHPGPLRRKAPCPLLTVPPARARPPSRRPRPLPKDRVPGRLAGPVTVPSSR